MSYLKKTLAAVVAGGTLLFGGNALADVADDAMWTFREAYVSAPQDDRAFKGSVMFFGTTFRSELNADAQVLRDASMRIKGNMHWTYTNSEDYTTSNINIPFYITQDSSKDMMVYIQRNGRWNKFPMAGISYGLINAIKTTDVAQLQQNLNAVKSVSIFKDSDTLQVLNITLDGLKVADMFQNFESESPSGLTGEELESHKTFIRNITNALSKNDLVCTWVVNKQTKETVAFNANFTELMRAYARSVLDESAAGTIVLSDEEREFMETLGYYSEFHFTTRTPGADDKIDLKAPRGVSRAAFNSGVLDDIFDDMTTAR